MYSSQYVITGCAVSCEHFITCTWCFEVIYTTPWVFFVDFLLLLLPHGNINKILYVLVNFIYLPFVPVVVCCGISLLILLIIYTAIYCMYSIHMGRGLSSLLSSPNIQLLLCCLLLWVTDVCGGFISLPTASYTQQQQCSEYILQLVVHTIHTTRAVYYASFIYFNFFGGFSHILHTSYLVRIVYQHRIVSYVRVPSSARQPSPTLSKYVFYTPE